MASLVTAKELGQYLKLSESTIYRMAFDGDLPGFKIGDSWRFDMEEVVKLIKKAKKGKNNKKGKSIGKEGREVKEEWEK
jgi:excisionase family DNA binding protein